MAGFERYDEDEGRGFLRLRGVSLAFTVGAIVLLVGSFFLIAVVPSLLADTGLGTAGRVAAGVLRWVLLLLVMLVGLAVLYRYGPNRDEARTNAFWSSMDTTQSAASAAGVDPPITKW